MKRLPDACKARALIIAALGAFMLPPTAFAQFAFQYHSEDQRWTLANDRIEASIALGSDGSFTLQFLRTLNGRVEWRTTENACASPFSLQADDLHYGCGTSFRLVSHNTQSIARNGQRQTIVLEDNAQTARVQLELDMFAGQPVLRQSVRFRNLRASSVKVRSADLIPLTLSAPNAPYRLFRVNQWSGGGLNGNFEPLSEVLEPNQVKLIYSGAGGQHCSWLAMRDGDDRGFFAGWEFNGRVWTTVQRQESSQVLVMNAPIIEVNRPIGPNQEFVVPATFLGLFEGGWDEAAYQTHRFVEAAVARPLPDARFPYVMWDSWGYTTDIDEGTLRREAQIASSLGIEVFVVDLGWSRQIGDWVPDPKKFPHGLKPLSDYVHSLGMKFGLHFALAEAAPASPVLSQYPDWRSSWNDNYFGAESLCLAHRPVRLWVIREAIRMIDEYGVDWMLQDGENMVKRCTKTSHSHDPEDSNYSNSVAGLDAVIDEVLRQRPNVHWENCEDGGNMMTYGMVRRYVTSIAADNNSPLVTRQAVYGATYPFPARYADRYMEEHELDTYVTRSFMFGGPWIFMNKLASMRSRDLQLAASEIQLYKSLRERIREGKIFHLTGRPAPGQIDALESYHGGSDTAIVFAYRTGAAASNRSIKLRGLKRGQTYEVRFHDSGTLLAMTGAQLLDRGVPISFRAPYAAEIVYVTPQ